MDRGGDTGSQGEERDRRSNNDPTGKADRQGMVVGGLRFSRNHVIDPTQPTRSMPRPPSRIMSASTGWN
jgi:hypothetical protein